MVKLLDEIENLDVDGILDAVEMADDATPLSFEFPTFEQNHYYGVAGEIALHAAENSEADPVAVYASFLAMAAALLGRHKYIQIGDSKHYARLYVALVGASSRSRKGTSFKPVERALKKSEETYHKRCDSDNLFIDSLHIVDGCLSSSEGLIFQVRDESSQKTKDGEPLWNGVDDKRLLVIEEELANTLKVCQREGSTLSATLRKAWDGGNLEPLTKNNRLRSTNPHINTLAHITQYELKHLLSQNDIHNGLANRYLWACVRRTKKMAFPLPMDDSQVLNFSIRISAAMKTAKQETAVQMDSDARDYWGIEYHNVSTDQNGLIGALTARAEAHVMRLSLLFCLIDGLNVIQQKHIEAAVNFVDFCNRSVEFIFSSPADADEGTDADKLLKALKSGPMTQTGISKLFHGNKKRKDLGLILKDLQQLNKIKTWKDGRTTVWEKIE